jgi:DNA-binding response OmpR family regulator
MTKDRIRILAVDDDRAALAALVAGLSRAGYDVVVASNADEAMRLALDVFPALALLSVRMEGRNGLDVAKFLGLEKRVPFLFVTGVGDRAIAGQVAQLGAAGFLTKPFDMTKVVPAVRAALAQAQEHSHLAEDTAMLADDLDHGRGREVLIAIGILVEREKVNCDDALELMHERASVAGLTLGEVAMALIEQAEGAARPAAST